MLSQCKVCLPDKSAKKWRGEPSRLELLACVLQCYRAIAPLKTQVVFAFGAVTR
jgi:hypothetical protein